MDQLTGDWNLYLEVLQWLYTETAVLDRGELEQWLEFVTSDFTYEMPVRVVRRQNDPESAPSGHSDAAYVIDDVDSLSLRAKRTETDYNWSEDPPSRTTRHLSNVRVWSDTDEELPAQYNVLVVRSRGLAVSPELVDGRREDRIVRSGGSFLLKSRRFFTSHAVLGARNITLPL